MSRGPRVHLNILNTKEGALQSRNGSIFLLEESSVLRPTPSAIPVLFYISLGHETSRLLALSLPDFSLSQQARLVSTFCRRPSKTSPCPLVVPFRHRPTTSPVHPRALASQSRKLRTAARRELIAPTPVSPPPSPHRIPSPFSPSETDVDVDLELHSCACYQLPNQHLPAARRHHPRSETRRSVDGDLHNLGGFVPLENRH